MRRIALAICLLAVVAALAVKPDGSSVLVAIFNSNHTTTSVSEAAAGVYFVSLETARGTFSRAVIRVR
jgi:hypothetical protein